jgi:hypothetical protein
VARKVFLILLALVLALSVGLAACTAEPSGEEQEEEEEEEEEEEFWRVCVDFEDLPLAEEYHVGDTINTSGAVIGVEQFQGFSGYAEVGDQELAGGLGQELGWINNLNLRFDFGGTCEVLYILFGAYGGDLYLEINGESATITDFSDVIEPLGDVHVRVEHYDNIKGRLKLTGTINRDSLVIGGQELAIDHICQESPQEQPTTLCVDFEDLPLAEEYHVGDNFADSGVAITVEDFQWGNSQWTDGGYARVENEGLAGWLGQDMLVNNVNLRFDFGESSYTGLSLRYGEYGGNINIEINGDLRNVDDFSDVISPVGGVHVSTGNLGNGMGALVLSGTINSLAIGGQELWIDHVCRVYPDGETAKADLVPAKAPGSTSSYASVDAEGKMVFYVRNQGMADAPASTTGVKVLDTGHTYYLSTPAIPAGDTVETQQLVPDCGPSAGDCHLEITADHQQQVDESSETNNTVSWTIPR